MIELYIENRLIDLSEDIEINFTYETLDPDKLLSIKNSFSKTVNIPGTANNNITFGHIFRMDKYIPVSAENIGNNYDPHKKVNWFINKDGVLVNRGYCTLDNIVIKNERDITYQLTLYGGIGEFFYSLSYNDEGEPKTLYDVFFDWYPKTSLLGHGAAMSFGSEQTKTLMKCSADIVSQSYHSLNPFYRYTGTTDIEKDVIFVPCYCGLYENFDSKHMLVSTFNQNYNTLPALISTEKKNTLMLSFPDSITDSDGSTYYTIGSTFSQSDAYRYGIATFSRDLEPSEAGDLRVNELPLAIRLSKLLYAVSQPVNNGGYTVVWDSSITDSNYWKYGWVMLGKIKQDRENLESLSFSPSTTYDGQPTTIKTTWSGYTGNCTTTANASAYDIPSNIGAVGQVNKGKYKLSLSVIPSLVVRTRDGFPWPGWFVSGSWKSNARKQEYRYLWTTSVLVHKIYDGDTLIKSIADIFYYSQDPDEFYFGKNNKNLSIDEIKQTLSGRINQLFMNSGEFIDEYNFHDCKVVSTDAQLLTPSQGNNYAVTNIVCQKQKISTNINITADTSTLRVEQLQGLMWTKMTNTQYIACGKYGTDSISFDYWDQRIATSTNAPFGFANRDGGSNYWWTSSWPFIGGPQGDDSCSVYFNMNEGAQNGLIFADKVSGFNIIKLDKQTLFTGTSSPMKYLTDFCKLMNYKITCDNTTKTVRIMPVKKYYRNTSIDLTGKVDFNRDVKIKNVLTNSKIINFGLNTPETYPVMLFNKNSVEKFNTVRYNTGLEYNALKTNLLDNLIYKNTIDWQLSSVYFNIYPQIPRPYAVPSISWTLFNNDNNEIKKNEFFTTGIVSSTDTLSARYDFLPKIAGFDKTNKNVDIKDSLIFLNGFVSNYDYSLTESSKATVEPDSIDSSHYISSSGTRTSSSYQDIYTYTIVQGKNYYVTASFGNNYTSYIVNYYNSGGTRIGTQYSQTNTNYTDAPLTIPANAVSMKCNFRKADTTAKIRTDADWYTVSPKLIFTNDTYEQYYLAGGRCYMSDFKYNDNFTSWGCYSSDQKGSAASWTLPFFTRDLYNVCDSSGNWTNMPYKVASWNITQQDGLDNLYDLSGTRFIKDPGYEFSKRTSDKDSVDANTYEVSFIPADEPNNTRIYDTIWKSYLGEMYGRNVREVTLYVDLSRFSDPNEIMRNIYVWKGHKWIITKIFNYRVSNIVNDRFTKVTLHKIVNINNWI